MKWIFWLSLALLAYAYFGYAILLWLQVRIRQRPTLHSSITPTVTIVIAARNEEENLPAKLDNLRKLDYPQDRLQIVIVSDGSTDRTSDILREHSAMIFPVILESTCGKACALNAAVQHSTGEILVFLDARQRVDRNAILELVSCFADVTVGAVSGELLLESKPCSSASEALGIYWKMEKVVRKLESGSGSVVGVTGAIYAIRHELYTDMPCGTILDDVFIPMQVARAGYRVIFQPSAIVYDKVFSENNKEFSRKVRTLTGNYQLLRLVPWLLSPANPLLFRLISHKLLRLMAPLLLLLTLLASAITSGPLYLFSFWIQVILYGLALIGWLLPATRKYKLIAITHLFVLLNVTAVLAFYNFVTRRSGIWA
jgi:cellulose synthase/poly-beta-1,6-N-acetylglucosamine synthase-like glycosyltransferase